MWPPIQRRGDRRALGKWRHSSASTTSASRSSSKTSSRITVTAVGNRIEAAGDARPPASSTHQARAIASSACVTVISVNRMAGFISIGHELVETRATNGASGDTFPRVYRLKFYLISRMLAKRTTSRCSVAIAKAQPTALRQRAASSPRTDCGRCPTLSSYPVSGSGQRDR